MAQTPYSPLMLIAAAGLIQNQGLAVNSELLSEITRYRSISSVAAYRTVLEDATVSLAPATIAELQSLANNVFPALTDAVPGSYTAAFGTLDPSYFAGLTGLTLNQANIVMSNGNLGDFVQIYGAAQAYIFQTNSVINSVLNSDLIAETFVSMDVLITGNTSDIAENKNVLASDLKNAGNAWNLNELDRLGFPSTLLRQMSLASGLHPELVTKIAAAGIPSNDLVNIIREPTSVTLATELVLYEVFESITGTVLNQIKFLLDVTTPGIQTVAELLDPVKLLPNSYQFLTLRITQPTGVQPADTTLVNIYLANGSINSNLLNEFSRTTKYQDLSRVTPAAVALGNCAIARSLQQIKNIFVPTLPEFSDALSKLETTEDLSQISQLDEPIPAALRANLLNILAIGSGVGGTLTLIDLLGAAAGVPYADVYKQIANAVSALQEAGSLSSLNNETNGVWTVMQNALDGDYDVVQPTVDPNVFTTIYVIPLGLPGAGTYNTLDEAFVDGLIPAAIDAINTIVSNTGNVAATTTALVDTVSSTLVAEIRNFSLTELDLNELSPNNRTGLMTLAFNLHDIGQDVSETRAAEFFARIADRSNIFGQSIVAAMRESRNIETLNTIGIDLDTQIPLL